MILGMEVLALAAALSGTPVMQVRGRAYYYRRTVRRAQVEPRDYGVTVLRTVVSNPPEQETLAARWRSVPGVDSFEERWSGLAWEGER